MQSKRGVEGVLGAALLRPREVAFGHAISTVSGHDIHPTPTLAFD
jgi:hypothetical protein